MKPISSNRHYSYARLAQGQPTGSRHSKVTIHSMPNTVIINAMSDPWSRYYARRGAVWSEMDKFSDYESIGSNFQMRQMGVLNHYYWPILTQ